MIALNFYMVGMQNAVWTYKNTMGLFRQGRYLLILTAAINLVCSLWLGKLWGLFGILLATAISRACTNAWYDPYAVFKYGLKEKVSVYYKKIRIIRPSTCCCRSGLLRNLFGISLPIAHKCGLEVPGLLHRPKSAFRSLLPQTGRILIF